MYDEEILHALKARQYNAIRANERTLLSEMQFTIERNSIRVDGDKKLFSRVSRCIGRPWHNSDGAKK